MKLLINYDSFTIAFTAMSGMKRVPDKLRHFQHLL
jgi:hypothetical protein